MTKELLLTVALTILTAACANNGNPKVNVPDHVEVTGETTVHVMHEIVVSVAMQGAMLDECKQANPDATQEELTSCQNAKIKEFVDQFLQLLNQNSQGVNDANQGL